MSRHSNKLSKPKTSFFDIAEFGNSIIFRLGALDFRISRTTLLAVLIGGAALVVAVISPVIAQEMRLAMLVIAALVGVLGLLVLLRWPNLGITGIIVAGLVVPFSLGTGSETGINAAVLLLLLMIGLWLLEMVARRKDIRLLSSRAVTAVLVFSVFAVIAFGFGQIPWFSVASAPTTAQFGGLMVFLLSAGAFLLVAHQIRSMKELEWMIWVLMAIGFVYFLGRIVLPRQINIYQFFVRQGVLGSMFYVWMVAMGLSQALFNRDLERKWRIALVIVVLMIFYINLGKTRDWASGWLPAGIAAVMLIFVARPRLGIAIMVVGGLYVLFDSQLPSEIVSEGDNLYSLTTRVEAWKILGEIIKVNPIFGLGMANYYFYTPLYSILGYNVQFNSHNNYIDIIAQAGIVGLICFFWIVWEVFKVGWQLRDRAPEGFARAFVYGVIGGLAGTVVAGMLGDWVLPFVYNIGLEGFRASVIGWMFMGGLLALQQILEKSGGNELAESNV